MWASRLSTCGALAANECIPRPPSVPPSSLLPISRQVLQRRRGGGYRQRLPLWPGVLRVLRLPPPRPRHGCAPRGGQACGLGVGGRAGGRVGGWVGQRAGLGPAAISCQRCAALTQPSPSPSACLSHVSTPCACAAGGHELHQRLCHHLHVPEPAVWRRQALGLRPLRRHRGPARHVHTQGGAMYCYKPGCFLMGQSDGSAAG